ncbi:MAG: S4 domain-containing protein [Planctomycetota bacterium]|jgi:23S rRNA-/tRNA-specific pseudouridylate synthase
MDPDLDPSTPRRVPPELDGQRLDRILTELFPGRSRAAWQKAVRRGEVLLDGTPLRRSNISLRRGQRLSLAEPIEEAPAKRPAIEPVVIHADDDLVVIADRSRWTTTRASTARESCTDSTATRVA